MIKLDIKRKVIALLWVMTAGVFIGMAGFDSIGDGMLNWSYYLFLETSVVTMISSTVIWFFTEECYICGKIVISNDTYCKRCGTDLTRKNVVLTSCEMDVKSESPQEQRPQPVTRTRTSKKLA